MNHIQFNRLSFLVEPFDLDEVVNAGEVKTPYEHVVSEEKFACKNIAPRKQTFVFIPFTEIEGTMNEMLQKLELRPVTPAEFIAVCKELTTKDPQRFSKNAIVSGCEIIDEKQESRTLVLRNGSVQVWYTLGPGGMVRVWPSCSMLIGIKQ